MKSINLDLPLFSEVFFENFQVIDNQILKIYKESVPFKNLMGFFEEQIQLTEETIKSNSKTVYGYSKTSLKRLKDLQKLFLNTRFAGHLKLLQIFPHRRETMSVKYIAKQLGLSIKLLELWLSAENVEIIHKPNGKYVDVDDVLNFMIVISQIGYNFLVTLSNNQVE